MSQGGPNWRDSFDQPAKSQFPGGGRRQVRGTYDNIPPSARWQFNAKDAASVGATMVALQPVLMPVAMMLEGVADRMMPAIPENVSGMHLGFWAALAGQTLAVGLLKGLVNLMRSYGTSVLKDVLAWLALILGDLIRSSVLSALFGWIPWPRRRRRRPQPNWGPDDEDELAPPDGPWRRWRDRRRERRNRR